MKASEDDQDPAQVSTKMLERFGIALLKSDLAQFSMSGPSTFRHLQMHYYFAICFRFNAAQSLFSHLSLNFLLPLMATMYSADL